MIKKLLAVAGLLTASAFASASGNLVTNGSFEAPDIPNATWTIFGAIPGWSAATLGVEVRDHVAGNASDGNQYVELDTTGNSWISQTLTTTAGQLYLLSFDYSPRQGVSYVSNPINVFWNGVQLGMLPFSVSGVGGSNGNVWNTYQLQVQAFSGHSTLKFAAAGVSDSYGGSLDKVAVVAIPEPETYAMLLAGLGLMGAVARRRNQIR